MNRHQQQPASFAGARLDLGCGTRKRGPEYIGVDLLRHPEVDVVGDAFEVLREIPDGVIEEVYSSHFLEHVEDPRRMLSEMCRVTREGGRIEVVVPHFSNPYFWSDPTHRQAFGLYTLAYWVSEVHLHRRVPRYEQPLPLRLEGTVLGFKSTPPFYGRHAFKRVVHLLVNSSRWAQEFYEENLVYMVPCYEVEYSLVKL